jgi:hypothetical protein
VAQEGWGMEWQHLNKELNAEWDTERIVGKVETAWEKVAVGKKMETAKTTAQTTKRTAETRKQMVEMQKQTVKAWKKAVGTQKTSAVNTKTEGESLYQNHSNTHQTDGRTILYTLKKKKLNREQEQKLVY